MDALAEIKWKKLSVSDIGQLVEMRKNIITKKRLSEMLGVTENGLAYTFKHETLKFTMFQEICELIEINPIELFYRGIDHYKKAHFDSLYEPQFVRRNKDTEIQTIKREMRELRDLNAILVKAVSDLEARCKTGDKE